MYVCMYVCVNVRMYVCVYVLCMYVYIISIYESLKRRNYSPVRQCKSHFCSGEISERTDGEI